MALERSLRGGAAGAVAAAAWAAQQPLDKRAFRSSYDDLELLGKLITRGDAWRLVGLALHLQNGALFGALYAQLRPLMPGPPLARAVAAGMAEHAGTWLAVGLVDRHHPARHELPALKGSRRALAQATWRHLVFGLVLGALEQRLNAREADEPLPIPVSSNGHGSLEEAVGVA